MNLIMTLGTKLDSEVGFPLNQDEVWVKSSGIYAVSKCNTTN